MLRRRGVTRVRPLAGGFNGWRDRGFPLEPIMVATPPPLPDPKT